MKLLSPILPHLSEEIYHSWGNKSSIAYEAWPKYDDKLALDEKIEMVIQVNGKLRASIEIEKDTEEEKIVELAKDNEKISEYLKKGNLIKTIFVKNRLVNFVVKIN